MFPLTEWQVFYDAMSVRIVNNSGPAKRAFLFGGLAAGEVPPFGPVEEHLSSAGDLESFSDGFIRFSHKSVCFIPPWRDEISGYDLAVGVSGFKSILMAVPKGFGASLDWAGGGDGVVEGAAGGEALGLALPGTKMALRFLPIKRGSASVWPQAAVS